MTPVPRRIRATLLAALALFAIAPAAFAQAWPSKGISIIVSYPPGGDTDALARVFAEKLAPRVGQSVVVENRPGASGTIGNAHVAKAAPDGHTLRFTPNTISIATLVLKAGSGPAITDLVGGHIPMLYTARGLVAPHVAAGKLAVLAVADPQRSPLQPNVPNLAEAGFRDAEVGAWQGFMGPGGMPPAVVRTLNTRANEIIRMPDVGQRLTTLATIPVGGDPSAIGKLNAADHVRYGKVVKEFGIQAE